MDKPIEPTQLRILLLEDEPTDAELMEDALREAGLSFIAKRVDTREAFIRALEEFKPDIVLADYKLPSFDGGTALKIVRQQYPTIPVVIVTGAMGDEKAIELLKQGAKNYVLKDRLVRLGPAVQMALAEEQDVRARKAAEQTMRQSEANFRALVENSPIAMLVDAGVGADEKIVMMNRKFTELFGYTLEDVPDAQHWWPLAYPDEAYREELKAEWAQRVEKAFRSRSSIEPMEASITCKDGAIRYVRGSFASIGDKNILGFEDLTKRKQAEDELERFFNLIPDLVCIASADGHFLKINPAWQELLGYTTQEILAKPFLDLIHPDDRAATVKEVERQLAGEATMQLSNRYRCKDGSYKWLEWKATPAVGGKLLFASARDITERRQAEESFRISQARFSTIFYQASFGIALIDSLTGRIQEANPRFAEIAGRTIEEIAAIDWMNITHPDDVQKDLDNMALLNAGKIPGFNMDKRYIRPDGSIVWINMTIAPLREEHAISPRHLCMIDDITERRLAEARIQKLTRLYATLSQTNQAIVRSSTTGREELFLNICDAAVTHGNFIMAWVGLVDETTRTVKPVCHYGAENGYLTNIDVSIDDVPSGRGPTGTAIRDNRVSYVNDYANDPRTIQWREAALQRGFRCAAGLPLRFGDKVIGALTLYADEPGFFDADQLNLLEEMATDVSFALNNIAHEAERSAAELQLKERERQYHTLADSGQALIWTAGTDKLCDYFNKVWLEFTGRPLEQLLGNGWADDVHPDDFAQCLATYVGAFDRREPFSMLYRLRRHDGEYRWLQDDGCPRYNAAGEFIGYIGYCLDITEHKKAEARLAESEERYRLVQENSMDAILLTAPDGSIFSANKAACAMFQRTEEEICRLGRNALADTNDPRLAALLEERTRSGKASGKLTMLRKDGSRFPVEISSSLFTDSHGNKRSSMIIRDITERSRAEARLAESEQHFRAVAESANDAIVTVSGSGGIVDWNPAAERLFGRTKAEMTGLPLTALMPERFRNLHSTGMARVASGGTSHVIGKAVELAGLRKDGSEFPLELSLAQWHVGQSQFFTAIIRDISERKQAERILWESEERYRSLFENMLEGYAHCKMLFEQGTPQDFIYIDVNRAFEKLTGLKNVAGKKVTEVIPGIRASNPELFEIYGRVALTGQPEKFDTYLGALEIWLSVTVYSPQKEYFIAIFDNITERKRVEAQQALEYRHIAEINLQLTEANKQLKLAQSQLLQSAKMASVGLLAAGVAHEINNPIGYVNSNLGTLEKYLADIFAVIDKFEAAEMLLGMLVDANDPLLEELRQFKEKINLDYVRKDIKALIAESHQGLERVKRIVLDLKNFSHADSDDQWLWADIHQVLDATLNVVWNELKYKCEVVKEYGALPKVYCLPSQLDQVFMNLLVNAAQAIEVRGKITLRTGQEGDRIWVEVSDTGKGIAPENIPNLFDPFFTTKPVGKGTGLGLSVSYSIVEKHRGKIEVHSEVGKGSTFRVWLPVQQPGIEGITQ